MISLKMITNSIDLEIETGLTRDELWENGFNLDDWSVCFVSNVCLVASTEIDEDGDAWFDPIDEAYWLVYRMDEYCCGFTEVEYNGKWYYMVYHS